MIYEQEAEAVILGSMFGPMSSRTHVAACLEQLRPELFFVPAHRIVFNEIAVAFAQGADLTHPLTLMQALRRKGLEERVGGAVALFGLIEQAGSNALALAHIPTLERSHQLRKWETLRAEEGVTDDAIERIASQANALVNAANPTHPPRAIEQGIAALFERIERDEPLVKSFHAALPMLDSRLGGLCSKRLIVIGGKTGEGKTSLALQLAAHAAESGARVLFVSLEMAEHELVTKLVAMRAGVPTFRVTDPLDWEALLKVQAKAAGQPLLVDDTTETHFDRLRYRIEIAAGILGGLDLVVVDYLQLVTHQTRRETRNLDVGEVARGLKQVARKRDCCVIACSQLSRLHEQQGVKPRRPRLADLRESGDIEHAADQVILLYQPPGEAVDSIPTELIIAKNRHGARSTIDATFVASHSKFEEH